METSIYNKALLEKMSTHVGGETLFNYVKTNPDKAAIQIYNRYAQSLKRNRTIPASLTFDISDTGFKLISNDTSVIAAYDNIPGKSLFCGEPHFVHRIGHKRVKVIPFMIDTHNSSAVSEKLGSVPDYIFLIMSHLDPLSLLNARLVCKKWKQTASSNMLWIKWINILKQHNHSIKLNKEVPYFKTFIKHSLIGMVFKKSLEGEIIRILIDPKNENLVKFIFSKIVCKDNILIEYPNRNRKEIRIPLGTSSYSYARLLIIAGSKQYYIAPRLNEIRHHSFNNTTDRHSIYDSLSLYRSFLNNIF